MLPSESVTSKSGAANGARRFDITRIDGYSSSAENSWVRTIGVFPKMGIRAIEVPDAQDDPDNHFAVKRRISQNKTDRGIK